MTKEIMQAIENVETLVDLDNAMVGLGFQTTIIDMDNKMEELGFQSIFDEVDETTLKNNGSASYLVPGTETDYINVEFDVYGDNIKITAVEEI